MTLAFDIVSELSQQKFPEEPRLIHEYFERQADLRPGYSALECEGHSLTYAELECVSNKIAHFLKGRKIGPHCLVGIYFNKSCNLFAAILGVLKAGAGYVPIDPKIPPERLSQIVDDADLPFILTSSTLANAARSVTNCAFIALDHPHTGIQSCSSARPSSAAISENDLCYVIYTSGSTGRPKGVALEHRNVVNFIGAIETIYRVTSEDRIYQGFSVAFDASVEEIWAALSLGGTLVVPPEEVARSPEQAAHFINENRITYFSTVPSFLSFVTDDLADVRILVLGGEACPASSCRKMGDAGAPHVEHLRPDRDGRRRHPERLRCL